MQILHKMSVRIRHKIESVLFMCKLFSLELNLCDLMFAIFYCYNDVLSLQIMGINNAKII
jgi:hypothetical protein